MRKFIAGLAAGLALGLVTGVAGSYVFGVGNVGPDSSSPRPVARNAAGIGPVTNIDRAPTTRSDVAGGLPPAGQRKGRVERPVPQKRERLKQDPSSEEATPPSRESLLEDVEALFAPGVTIGGGARHAAEQLAERATAEGQPLSFHLVAGALARADDFDSEAAAVARALVAGVSEEDAQAALYRALAGDERLLWIAEALASAVTSSDVIDLGALANELLASSSRHGRLAGVYLSQWAETPPMQSLLHVAQSDPDDETRSFAIDIVTDFAAESDDPEIREMVVPLVLGAALQGTAEARREAIYSFEDVGASAADAALQLLREGGLDEELTWYVVQAVLVADRTEELMQLKPTVHVASAAISWLRDGEDDTENATRLKRALPYLGVLVRVSDDDSAESLFHALLEAGELATLEKLALSDGLSEDVAEYALDCFFSLADDAPEDRQNELETRAIRVLTAYLDPSRTSVERRRRTVQSAAEGGLEVDSQRLVTAAIAALANSARSDPNSWVRGIAAEAVESFSAYWE